MFILIEEPEMYMCGCGRYCSYDESMCLCEEEVNAKSI